MADPGGKHIFKFTSQANGSNTLWSLLFIVFIKQFSRKINMNNLSPKWANRIWLNSSLHVDYKCHTETIQKLTYNKIRSMKVLMHKLKIQISPWISNENARFKLHSTLCQRIYLCHMLISKIKRFEISPYDEAVLDSGVFEVPMAWTGTLWWCRRWLEHVL